MKSPVYSSLLLSLGLCSPLVSAEQPPSVEEKLPEKQNAEAGGDKAQEMRPAWLGVFGEKAGEALRARLMENGYAYQSAPHAEPQKPN